MPDLTLRIAFAALAAVNPLSLGRGSAEKPIVVFVSVAPQAYFVEQLAGERAAVHVLVPPGQSPATYDPTPAQVASLAGAAVYFRVGVPFEDVFLARIASTYPNLRIVDTRKGVPLRAMSERHRHPGEADRPNGRSDPHIWLSPRLVKIQAATMCDAFSDIDPSHAALYSDRLAAFCAFLDALDQRIASALSSLKGKSLMVFHPAYGYFADAYGLHQVAVEIEGKEPTAKELATIMERAKREDFRVLFVQPQFSTRTAEAIAREIGAAVIPLDPLARDYASNLERMAETIRKLLAAKEDG